MLNFRNTSLLYLLAAFLIWATDMDWDMQVYILLAYLLVLFLGSYRIGSQFYMPVICNGVTTQKKIALSFDDGPAALYTPAILDILQEKQVPAAFFCIGQRIAGNEKLVERIHAEGHLVGNHSYTHHAIFDLYSAARMEKEIRHANKAVQDIIGKIPRLFRPPYGVTNPNLAKAVKHSGMIATGWNIRSMDTVAKNEEKLLAKLMRSLQPGAIVLFHDTMKITASVLPEFIDAVKQQGYSIVRLDELINEAPYA